MQPDRSASLVDTNFPVGANCELFMCDLLNYATEPGCKKKTNRRVTNTRTNKRNESAVSDGTRLKTSHFKTKINPTSFTEETQAKTKAGGKQRDQEAAAATAQTDISSVRMRARLYDDPVLLQRGAFKVENKQVSERRGGDEEAVRRTRYN